MKTTQTYKICDNLIGISEIQDNSIDLTVTSPPYDEMRTYNAYNFNFESLGIELYRITKNGGVVVWIVGDATKNGSESGTSFKQALYFKEVGFNLHDTMIYRKLNFPPLTHSRYEQAFEYMFILSKGKPKTFNPLMVECIHAGKIIKRTRKIYESGMAQRKTTESHPDRPTASHRQKENVWDYKVGGYGTVNHPAQFPEQLVKDHILSWSNEGDIVLDPFLGSGTTLKMCIETNRNGIGFEINEGYETIIKERLKVDTTKLDAWTT